jgi:hypothetical protein
LKKFHFPLERVLAFRRTQLQIEQSKLERITLELKEIDSRIVAVEKSLQDSRTDIVRSQSKLGRELESFETFRGASEKQTAALAQARRACLDRISIQCRVLKQKERDVKLLEQLREDRIAAWRAAQAREVDQQAEESHLARWRK